MLPTNVTIPESGRFERLSRLLRRARGLRGAMRTLPSAAPPFPDADYARLKLVPPCLRTVDPMFETELAAGTFALAGHVVRVPKHASIFAARAVPEIWAEELHGLSWLTHLKAANTILARKAAIDLMNAWFASDLSDVAWHPDVASRRILQWLSHADMLLAEADQPLIECIAQSLAETLVRLSRGVKRIDDPELRLLPRIALLTAYLVLPDRDKDIEPAEAGLARDIAFAVTSDGMIKSRNPAQLVTLLQDVLALKQVYGTLGRPLPQPLLGALAEMPATLMHLQMGDANLARFNGVGRSDTAAIATLLAQTGVVSKRPTATTATTETEMRLRGGYARLDVGSVTVVVDAAAIPLHTATGHAGPTSFVMSCGPDLVVTNQGHETVSGSARGRASAQHAMLVLGQSSAALTSNAHAQRAHTEDFVQMPRVRPIRQHNAACDALTPWPIELEHDGYVSRYGLVVERRLRIVGAGARVEGIDGVREVMTARNRARHVSPQTPFALHFPLGPRITIARESAQSIAINLFSGARLRFVCANHTVHVEPSILIGTTLGTLETSQLVVRGHIAHGESISWSFERV